MRIGERERKRGREGSGGKQRVHSRSPFSVWFRLKGGGAAGPSVCRAGWWGEGTVEKGGRVRLVWVRVGMSFIWTDARQRDTQRGREGQRSHFNLYLNPFLCCINSQQRQGAAVL